MTYTLLFRFGVVMTEYKDPLSSGAIGPTVPFAAPYLNGRECTWDERVYVSMYEGE